MNCIYSLVCQAPSTGNIFKFGRSKTRESAIMNENQKFNDINDFVYDVTVVINFCDLRKYEEAQRIVQVFQELSDEVSGASIPTVSEIIEAAVQIGLDNVRKRRRMTGRLPRQDDLKEKTVVPLRQYTDTRVNRCRFVGKVVAPSVCISTIPLIVQEGSWIATQDLKHKNLEENERKKPSWTSKDSGDGAPKNLLNAGRRKRKNDDEMSKPCGIPSNVQVHRKEALDVNGLERPRNSCRKITKKRRVITLNVKNDVFYFGVKGRRRCRKGNN